MDETRGLTTDSSRSDLESLLLTELRWVVTLRWAAGGAIVVFELVQWRWLGWFESDLGLVLTGVAILLFNLGMWGLFRRPAVLGSRPRLLTALTVTQILFDLGCLTALVMLTGGASSPVLGFYVFHMVFASTLLSRVRAYAAALVSTAFILIGLAVTGEWPGDRVSALLVAGWCLTLVLTVYLASRLARGLRRRERRLIEQNREINAMSERLKAHQQNMIQHEKMVAMGRLAAGVAHEIANPLAGMDSVLQLMQRRPDRPRAGAVQDLREQIKRIHEIVRGMTDFAHPEVGRPRDCDVNEVIRGAIEMLMFDRRLRDAEVHLELDPAAAHAKMSPRALQQVLINLVLNALDAMAETDAPRLVVRSSLRGSACVIEVEDNGVGIPPTMHERVFEPFFTTKPAGKGTGLGLSICFNVMEDQGGGLEVESEPGCTTFRVHIPVMEGVNTSGRAVPIGAGGRRS